MMQNTEIFKPHLEDGLQLQLQGTNNIQVL